jgi:Amidohydrolase family
VVVAKRYVLSGADLIDGTGGPVVADSMVVFEGDCIVYAGKRADRFVTADAEHWQLAGKTIVPGLIEAHTHATFDADLKAYIKNGITTIRYAGLNHSDVRRVRERIDAGKVVGPRILSAGWMIDEPPVAYPEWSIAVGTAAEAAIIAERMILEEKVDALIVTQRVTAAVMKAVIDAAHAHRRRVIGQTWAVDGETAAKLGIDELHTSSRVYRGRLYPEERLLRYQSIADRLGLASRAWASLDWDMTLPIMEAMVQRDVCYCGMHVITQFQVGEGVADLEDDSDFHTFFSEREYQAFRDFTRRLQGSWTAEDLEWARRANDMRMEWMRRFRSLGGQLLAGTDMQFGGIMLHRELVNLEALGMSPLQVITAATGACAKALRLDHEIGFVKQGLKADLVVLERSPLQDLGALRAIDRVLKNGAIVNGR